MRANITLGFSRPWNTPRTRAQEVLENLGGITPLKRAYKVDPSKNLVIFADF
jgi:hypothetical protein